MAVVTATWTVDVVVADHPPRWSEAGLLARQATLVIGPVLATLGAWVAGFRHSAAIGPIPTIGWHRIAWAQVMPLARSALVGHLVGLMPVLGVTWMKATGGSPAVLGHVSVMMGVLSLLGLGYLLGVVWDSRLVLVGAALGAFVLLFTPYFLGLMFAGDLDEGTSGTSFFGVSWLWLDFNIEPGFSEAPLAGVLRLLWFASLFGAALLGSIVVADARMDGTWRSVGALFIVPLAIGALVVRAQPVLKEPNGEPEICETVTGSTVCLPGEVRHHLPYAVQGVNMVVDVFGYGALERERQGNSRPFSEWGVGLSLDDPPDTALVVAESLMFGVAGSSACLHLMFESNADSQEPFQEKIELADGIARAMQTHIRLPLYEGHPLKSGSIPPPLADLSSTELRNFIDLHADLLATCSFTPEIFESNRLTSNDLAAALPDGPATALACAGGGAYLCLGLHVLVCLCR